MDASSNVKEFAGKVYDLFAFTRHRITRHRLRELLEELVLEHLEYDFLEDAKFVLQKQNRSTGEWQTYGIQLLGRTRARRELNDMKKLRPDRDWRVLPKVVADAYKQGWKDHANFVMGVPLVKQPKRRLA